MSYDPMNTVDNLKFGVNIMLYSGGVEDGQTFRVPAFTHKDGAIDVQRARNVCAEDGTVIKTVYDLILFKWDGTHNPDGQARYREVRK